MLKTLRLLLVSAALAAAALAGNAAPAFACGNSSGYSYAGLGSPSHAYGISALITPLDAFDVFNGHVAGGRNTGHIRVSWSGPVSLHIYDAGCTWRLTELSRHPFRLPQS